MDLRINQANQTISFDFEGQDPYLQPLTPAYADREGHGLRGEGYAEVRALLRLDVPVPITGADEQSDAVNEAMVVRERLVRRHLERRRSAIGGAAINGV